MVGLRDIRIRQVAVMRRTKSRFAKDMQHTRLKLINDLQVVFNMSRDYAQSKAEEITPKQKQIWVRIMAYTGQVINSISNSFDEGKVSQDLERLEKMINEAVATEKSPTTKTAS